MADTTRAAGEAARVDSTTRVGDALKRRRLGVAVLVGASVGVAAALLSNMGMSPRVAVRTVNHGPVAVARSSDDTASPIAPINALPIVITDTRAIVAPESHGDLEPIAMLESLRGLDLRRTGSSLNYRSNRLSRTSRGGDGPVWQHTPGNGAPAFNAHEAVGMNGNGGVIRPGELSDHGATPNAASGFRSVPFGDRRIAGPGQIDAREAGRRARAQVDQWGRQYCYRRALLEDPRLEGRLDVELSVDATGRVDRVTAAAAMNSSLRPAQEFRRCVERNLGGYSLGQPIGGPTQFAMTLNLSPGQRL